VTVLSREKYSVLANTVKIASPISKNSPSLSSFDGARSGYLAVISSAVFALASISSGRAPVEPT
jgi:hypothetical protein